MILPVGLMSKANIAELRKNEFCIVECKDPARVKFIDPIPAMSQRGKIEDAAIRLSRLLLNAQAWSKPDGYWTAQAIAKTYVEILVEGTPLDSRGTKEERESSCYDTARMEEVQKIAREDARAERAKKKSDAEKIESKTTGK